MSDGQGASLPGHYWRAFRQTLKRLEIEMDEQKQEIVKATENKMRELFKNPDVIAQFESILGKTNAAHYVGSVFIAVANSPELQECHPDSIIRSALRAAAFELSCDPSAKQGQLVPYWNSKRGRKEAQFIPHYKGMYTLALRSGLYRHINVSEIFRGYVVDKDMLTGLHSVTLNPKEFDPKVTIGYLGYFETKSGLKKSVYWTIEEIKAHAVKFAPKNPLYRPDSPHYKTMLEKTVWRDLLSWTDLGGTKAQDVLSAAIDDEVIDGGPDWGELETLEGKAEEIKPEQPAPPKTTGSPLGDLGFEGEKKAQPAPNQPNQPNQPETRPYPPATFKAKFENRRKENAKATVTDVDRKICAAALGKIFTETTPRYETCKWLTGIASTKDMTPATIRTLLEVMGVKSFDTPPSENSTKEFIAAHAAALIEAGQMTMQPNEYPIYTEGAK